MVAALVHEVFCLETDGNVWSLVVFILHHELESGSEETSLELVNVMAELIIELGDFRDVGIIDAKLSLADQDISVPEIDQQISVIGLESILYPQQLKLRAALRDLGGF